MADRKISDLTALTTPASGDFLPIVDISEAAAATKNKRITIEELMRGMPDGTAAAPGIAFENDPNTGIYSPGADQVAISTNGVQRAAVDSSGRVGIGTTAPNRKLEVSDASVDNFIRVNTTGATKSGIEFASGGTVYSQMYFNNVAPYDLSLLQQYTTGSLILGTNSTERARIDSSGRLLVGTSTSRAAITGNEATVQIEKVGTGITGQALSVTDNRTEQYGPKISLIKSRGSTLGSFTIVQSNDEIGAVSFIGTDGSKGLFGAQIAAFVDGTPGANDMPGRLVFSTTADGAAFPTERMRIKSTGIINFSNAPTHADNTAATAAGLAVGDVYKTVLGVLMIRF